LIVSWQGHIDSGGKTKAFSTLLDIAPTLLEAAGKLDESKSRFSKSEPMAGRSMLSYLTGKTSGLYPAFDGQGFELFANEAYIAGDWKILRLRQPAGDGKWKLYNLARDPGELTDLSAKFPRTFGRLRKQYDIYAKNNNVILRQEPFELFNNEGTTRPH
jgi:arylsulfatase A-like enzyme